MINKIQDLIKEVETFSSNNADEIEQFRIKFLSKKGIVTELFNEFKNIPKEEKKEFTDYEKITNNIEILLKVAQQ